MPPSSLKDTRFLERKNGKWRVTVAVPRDLQSELGTRLKRPLNTDSLTIANAMKWQVVSDLKATIAEVRSRSEKDPLLAEALQMAKLRTAANAEQAEHLQQEAAFRADTIRGQPIGRDESPFESSYVFDPARTTAADRYFEVASGTAVPISLHHSDYLKQLTVKHRTRADDERALRFLLAWCKQESVASTLQAITRRRAAKFMDGLAKLAGGQSPVTLQKYINRLSRYWQWLLTREYVETNPWNGLKLPSATTAYNEVERSFTDDEMLLLLGGETRQAMHDLMRIGALTGARLDAIVDLRVKDCVDGLFTFKPQKREQAARVVPIHSALVEIVVRRIAGQAPADDMFPEWPPPKKAGSMRERSFKASNAFTAYRRAVGVEQMVPGKRRSLVNFHSFRRWFITKAEQAGQPEHIIAFVVGHKRQGMTLGRYSAGPLLEQGRACVEAVRPPKRPES
jgi:integrase